MICFLFIISESKKYNIIITSHTVICEVRTDWYYRLILQIDIKDWKDSLECQILHLKYM